MSLPMTLGAFQSLGHETRGYDTVIGRVRQRGAELPVAERAAAGVVAVPAALRAGPRRRARRRRRRQRRYGHELRRAEEQVIARLGRAVRAHVGVEDRFVELRLKVRSRDVGYRQRC